MTLCEGLPNYLGITLLCVIESHLLCISQHVLAKHFISVSEHFVCNPNDR